MPEEIEIKDAAKAGKELVDDFERLLEQIKSSRKASIGSYQNAYVVQFNRSRIDDMYERHFGETNV